VKGIPPASYVGGVPSINISRNDERVIVETKNSAMPGNAGRMLRKITRWTLPAGFCALGVFCLMWAVQSASLSVPAAPEMSEIQVDRAADYGGVGSLLRFGDHLIYCFW
jgi:hypothetical protein